MFYSFSLDGFFNFLRTIRSIFRLLHTDFSSESERLIVAVIISIFAVIICFLIYDRRKEKIYERQELKERQSKSITLKNFDTSGCLHTNTGLINNQASSDELMKALGPIRQFDLQEGVTFYRTVNMVNFSNSYFTCTIGLKNDQLDIFLLNPDIDSFRDELGSPSRADMLVSLRRKMFSLYDTLTEDIEESTNKYFKISGLCICKLIHEDEEIPFIFFSFYIYN